MAGLYAAYARKPGPDYVGRQARGVFSPGLLDLMRRDVAATPKGDVGALDGDPAAVNRDPYGEGWMVTLRLADPGSLSGLLSPSAYRAHIGE